jgi:hypothetical protein
MIPSGSADPMISLGNQDAIDQAGKFMPLELGAYQPYDLVARELFNISKCFIIITRGNIRCNESVAVGGPFVRFHIVQTVFRIVAGDLTDGQECAKGIEQILRKVLPGNIFADPFYRDSVILGIERRRIKLICCGHFPDINDGLVFQGKDNPVSFFDFMRGVPEL